MTTKNKKNSDVRFDAEPLSERDDHFENAEREDSDIDCLNDDLSFVTDAIYSALLDPPSNALRNQYWCIEPRTLLDFQLSQHTKEEKPSQSTKRLLGLTSKGEPLFASKPTQRLLLSAAGGGKTTCGALPSFVTDTLHRELLTHPFLENDKERPRRIETVSRTACSPQLSADDLSNKGDVDP